MENKVKKEIERLWNEIFLLQAENAALKRKLGEEYRDFSFYRNSRWDRYLGMTAPMTQVPVPTATLPEWMHSMTD